MQRPVNLWLVVPLCKWGWRTAGLRIPPAPLNLPDVAQSESSNPPCPPLQRGMTRSDAGAKPCKERNLWLVGFPLQMGMHEAAAKTETIFKSNASLKKKQLSQRLGTNQFPLCKGG